MCGLDSFGFRYGPEAGFCEDGNRLLGHINCGEFSASWAIVSILRRILRHRGRLTKYMRTNA